MVLREKAKTMRVSPDFFRKVEAERQRFMKKKGLNKLTTVAFTGILEAKLVEGKRNVKRKKR